MEKTYNYLTSANGYSAIVYDDVLRRTKMFFPHIYRNINKDKEVKNILYDTYFGVRYNNKSFWLPEKDESYDYIGYLKKTGIINIKRRFDDIETEEYIFSPMSLDKSSMIMIIKIKALIDINELSVFSIHNFYLGFENNNVSFKKERIVYNESDAFIESSENSPYVVLYKPLVDNT
ncbi:MAG: hypothetical protein N2746_02975, partial [Deltaproteobacteria bacterium]|nr:hypothetical protein [Deltaproteobacteria bacterium]